MSIVLDRATDRHRVAALAADLGLEPRQLWWYSDDVLLLTTSDDPHARPDTEVRRTAAGWTITCPPGATPSPPFHDLCEAVHTAFAALVGA